MEKITFPYNLEARGWQDGKHFFRLQNIERVIDDDGNKVGEDKIVDVPIADVAALFPELEGLNAAMMATLQQQDRDISRKDERLSQLEDANNELTNKVTLYEQQTADIAAKIPQLIELNRQNKTNADTFARRSEDQGRLIQAAAHELEIAKARLEEQNTTLAAKEAELKAANAELDRLRAQVENQNSTINDLNAALTGERQGRAADRRTAANVSRIMQAQIDELQIAIEKTRTAETADVAPL
jgi:chromosome segregation ATPase